MNNKKDQSTCARVRHSDDSICAIQDVAHRHPFYFSTSWPSYLKKKKTIFFDEDLSLMIVGPLFFHFVMAMMFRKGWWIRFAVDPDSRCAFHIPSQFASFFRLSFRTNACPPLTRLLSFVLCTLFRFLRCISMCVFVFSFKFLLTFRPLTGVWGSLGYETCQSAISNYFFLMDF